MKRTVQLFHDVNGARAYPVIDKNMTVKDFVFSVVEELRNQDKEFFDVYNDDGDSIADRKVVDELDTYMVVCDIISARVGSAQRARQLVRICDGFHWRLRAFLESFDDVETCGFLLGTWDGETPHYRFGVFPDLHVQTRSDAVVGSQDVALVLIGMRNVPLPNNRLALAWIHTHLDTPPRLSAKDRRTLSRLRLLAPETCAMVFNRRFPDLGIVSYLSDATRVPLLEAAGGMCDDDFVTPVRDGIARAYAASGRKPPRFVV